MSQLTGKHILLIISGGIAAYKSLDLIRRLKEQGCRVSCILSKGGAEFITPLSVAALSGEKVYQDLFSLTDETDMGHIQLSRMVDLIVVAPASANMMAKMANGLADDLASTTLLATNKPVMLAPAMNPMMWQNPATQDNIQRLKQHGVHFSGPTSGLMACGETGAGRFQEVADILKDIETLLAPKDLPLSGLSALVTSGPTHEPIDPVRYIANRSSGKQGHAIAESLAALGAKTQLVTGPVNLIDPANVDVIHVETAKQMHQACLDLLPVDIAVCAAAVSDWRPAQQASEKMKKLVSGVPDALQLAENPDVLASISKASNKRPQLVVGFAAETQNIVDYATSKLQHKKCDWICANDVSPATGTFGANDNQIHLIRNTEAEIKVEATEKMTKVHLSQWLAQQIANHFAEPQQTKGYLKE